MDFKFHCAIRNLLTYEMILYFDMFSSSVKLWMLSYADGSLVAFIKLINVGVVGSFFKSETNRRSQMAS